MIRYSVVRIKESRVAAVLVEKKDLLGPRACTLIKHLEGRIELPVMLVARDEATWAGARVRADFEAEPFLYQMLNTRDLDWLELEAVADLEQAA